MVETRWLPMLALALGAACVTEGTYQKEVKKSEGLESQYETYAKLNTALKGEETLEMIIPTLKTLKGQRIEVEGFTDDVPIGHELKKRFPSNWELSTARATDVVRYLVAKGVDPAMLSAAGFGDTRPVASNGTAEGRAKNRRIELVLRADTP